MKRNLADIPSEYGHSNSVLKKKLISIADDPGRVATMNFAWLEKGMKLDAHKHKDGYEYYLFLNGKGTMFLDDTTVEVLKGDFIKVDSNVIHSLENNHTKKLSFITIRTVI